MDTPGRFFFLEVERGSGDGTGTGTGFETYDFDDACKTALHSLFFNFFFHAPRVADCCCLTVEEASHDRMLHRGDIVGPRCMESKIGVFQEAPFADFAAHGLYYNAG